MKRKVTRVKTHDLSVVIPGIGTLGTELPPAAKTVAMTMLEGDKGVEVHFEKNNLTYVIPYGNIQTYAVVE